MLYRELPRKLIPSTCINWKSSYGYKIEEVNSKVEYKDSKWVDTTFLISFIREKQGNSLKVIPEPISVDLKELRVDLENALDRFAEDLLELDFENLSKSKQDELLNLSVELTKHYGFLGIGNELNPSIDLIQFNLFRELMPDTGGISRLPTDKSFDKKSIEDIQAYYEVYDRWHEILRMMFYLKFFLGKQHPSISVELERKLRDWEKVFLSQLDRLLMDISPRVDWSNGSLHLVSDNLRGSFLLYYIDELHIPLRRCLSCKKHFIAERRSRKFCETGGRCSKIYQEIKKNQKETGKVLLDEEGFVMRDAHGDPIIKQES